MNEYKSIEQKRKFYDSGLWKSIRRKVMERDNNECQRCKRNGLTSIDVYEHTGKRKKIKLVVHHIKELEDHPAFALDIDNLEVCCVKCHNEIHGRTQEKKEPQWNDEQW